MASAATDDKKLVRMIKATGASFAPVILAEAKRERLSLALALALVDQESGFRNIFGCDPPLCTPNLVLVSLQGCRSL